MFTCHNCRREVTTVCADHMSCLACHEIELRHLVRERDQAHAYIRELQDQPPAPKVRTWAERTIGSQWNPSDSSEVDDIDKTCATIERVLFAIGGN